jgi:putative ABC transport system ATP-binding protein
MKPPAIELRDLEHAHGSHWTLHIPTWNLADGASALVYGPSGAGKSSLLRLLSGEQLPLRGSVRVFGTELTRLSDSERRAFRIRQIGLVFQDNPLVEGLNLEENVLLPYRLNPALRLDAKVRERARDLLGELGLRGREKHPPALLSGGERQRVAIARAMITEPRLILADEATAGLDPARAAQVVALLRAGNVARSLVLVSHDPLLAGQFVQTLHLREGRVG